MSVETSEDKIARMFLDGNVDISLMGNNTLPVVAKWGQDLSNLIFEMSNCLKGFSEINRAACHFNSTTIVIRQDDDPNEVIALWHQHRTSRHSIPPLAALRQHRPELQLKTTALALSRLTEVIESEPNLVEWVGVYANWYDTGLILRDFNAKVVAKLIAQGYKSGAHAGQPKEFFSTSTLMAEYIIGQLMDGLTRPLTIIPSTAITVLCQRYKNLYSDEI